MLTEDINIIHHFDIDHNTPCSLPKFCMTIVYNFFWVLQSSPSSETQGQSVRSGEKTGREFSGKGGRAPGYRLSPDHFQKFKRMSAPDWAQKMHCIIVPNWGTHLLSSFRVFVHDGYCLTACLARPPKKCTQPGNFQFDNI